MIEYQAMCVHGTFHSRIKRIEVTGVDPPITLKDACRDVFKDAISVATLMAEHRRENLVIYKIGRQYFTTPADIRSMLKKCRIESRSQPTTFVDIESVNAALAAARQVVAGLKRGKS